MSANKSAPGLSDKLYDDYVSYLTNKTVPSDVPSTKTNFVRDALKYEVKNGVLIREKKVVLKTSQLSSVWKQHHTDLLHPGKPFFLSCSVASSTFPSKKFFPRISKKTKKLSFRTQIGFS